MALECQPFCKSHGADVALEWPLARMDLHVTQELSLLGKNVVAHLTAVRLLPRVGAHMHDKVPLPVGAVRTQLARVVILDFRPIVFGHVFGKVLAVPPVNATSRKLTVSLLFFLSTLMQCSRISGASITCFSCLLQDVSSWSNDAVL